MYASATYLKLFFDHAVIDNCCRTNFFLSSSLEMFILLLYQGEYKAQREAVWAIKNLTAGGTIEQIVYIVTAGALKPLCDLLVVKETEMVTMILDTLINILNVSSGVRTSAPIPLK